MHRAKLPGARVERELLRSVVALCDGRHVAADEHDPPAGGGRIAAATEQKRASPLIELRAERVAHVGAAKESEGFDKPSLEIVVHRVPGRGERSTDMKIAIGRADSWRSMNVFYARRDGIDATFVIPASRVQPLLDAMSARSKD